MDYAELAKNLAEYVREVVNPLLGKADSRKVMGTADSGDATFNIDIIAEEAVVYYIESHGLNVAYYTEDGGLKEFGKPEATLIIDPIDGSRPAMAGFENCVVSVAVADFNPDARMRDVLAGCIYEIKDDRAFVAKRGQGVRVFENGEEIEPKLSRNESLECASWTAEIAGRPAKFITNILGEAIDASSIRGGFFIFSSTAYSLTRLVSGQLSAVVDVGARIVHDFPDTRDEFLKSGFGRIIGLFPYDFAAAVLVAQEAGCVVTDAYGNSLDDAPLLESSDDTIKSLVATSTPALHKQFLDIINLNFSNFRV